MSGMWIKEVDGKQYEVTPLLRFINRDGSMVLQQLLITHTAFPDELHEKLWADVKWERNP